jgi:hypothetical protein
MKNPNVRLWRVEWCHQGGYSAPQYHVETQEKDILKAKKSAVRLAKERSRLADFPKVWYFKLTLEKRDDETEEQFLTKMYLPKGEYSG